MDPDNGSTLGDVPCHRRFREWTRTSSGRKSGRISTCASSFASAGPCNHCCTPVCRPDSEPRVRRGTAVVRGAATIVYAGHPTDGREPRRHRDRSNQPGQQGGRFSENFVPPAARGISAHGANLVEIDLLRTGEPTVKVPSERLTAMGPCHYLTVVSRHWPARQEVYAIPLSRRLPRIVVPLAENEPGVVLDLQAAITRCWDEGPYPELLRYDEPPPGTLTPDEVRWCEDMLRQAGLRPPAQGPTG